MEDLLLMFINITIFQQLEIIRNSGITRFLAMMARNASLARSALNHVAIWWLVWGKPVNVAVLGSMVIRF